MPLRWGSGHASPSHAEPAAPRAPRPCCSFGAPVRCCSASPALDVVAVGLADGRVALHNLRFDTPLASFVHDAAGGAPSAVSPRRCALCPAAAVGASRGGYLYKQM